MPWIRAARTHGSRTTAFPVFSPACRQRNAETTSRSRSKARRGRPCRTDASARNDSRRSVFCIHNGTWSIVLSRAKATYHANDEDDARSQLHTERLPISPKHPPSPINASDVAMKSSERLFSTPRSR
eukprot:scaffold24657_cov129-Isochrysis_galbana.AAC.1